jgi:hypothetical protein
MWPRPATAIARARPPATGTASDPYGAPATGRDKAAATAALVMARTSTNVPAASAGWLRQPAAARQLPGAEQNQLTARLIQVAGVSSSLRGGRAGQVAARPALEDDGRDQARGLVIMGGGGVRRGDGCGVVAQGVAVAGMPVAWRRRARTSVSSRWATWEAAASA